VGGCARSRANRKALSFSLRSPLTEPPSVIDVAIGTFETCRRTPKMSAYRGKPEVIGGG
jgi:hypothetical protein